MSLIEQAIPYGYCHCGCGQKTTVPTVNHYTEGRLKGVPMRFIRGHHQAVRGPHLTHGCTSGRSQTPEYRTWSSMIQRVTNPRLPNWKYYGGRGIAVCERWRVFENFLADMGTKSKGTSLDRFPDNNGNYEPGNCRWATRKEQAINKRPRKKGVSSAPGPQEVKRQA